LRYLSAEWEAKKDDDVAADLPGWHVKVHRQKNNHDCGLYMLEFVERFARDHEQWSFEDKENVSGKTLFSPVILCFSGAPTAVVCGGSNKQEA